MALRCLWRGSCFALLLAACCPCSVARCNSCALLASFAASHPDFRPKQMSKAVEEWKESQAAVVSRLDELKWTVNVGALPLFVFTPSAVDLRLFRPRTLRRAFAFFMSQLKLSRGELRYARNACLAHLLLRALRFSSCPCILPHSRPTTLSH